jgi:hypothetical protein
LLLSLSLSLRVRSTRVRSTRVALGAKHPLPTGEGKQKAGEKTFKV